MMFGFKKLLLAGAVAPALLMGGGDAWAQNAAANPKMCGNVPCQGKQQQPKGGAQQNGQPAAQQKKAQAAQAAKQAADAKKQQQQQQAQQAAQQKKAQAAQAAKQAADAKKQQQQQAQQAAQQKKAQAAQAAKQAAEAKKQQQLQAQQAAQQKKLQAAQAAKQAAELKKQQQLQAQQAAQQKKLEQQQQAKQAAELKRQQMLQMKNGKAGVTGQGFVGGVQGGGVQGGVGVRGPAVGVQGGVGVRAPAVGVGVGVGGPAVVGPPPVRTGVGVGVGVGIGVGAAVGVGIASTYVAPPPVRTVVELRGSRQVVVDGGVTYVREPGRLIVRQPGGVAFVRSDEVGRFAVLGYKPQVVREGTTIRTFYDRPDGIRIITITDVDGRLIRRIRRFPDGREVILINNGFRPAPRQWGDLVVRMPMPALTIPRERYVVSAAADEASIYGALTAAPVASIGSRRYSLDEVRYSADLRARMPSVDIDTITFDTASWDVEAPQAQKLAVIARALNKAIQANPQEVFLVEGHTDAVGDADDNLSLSDRRAQSVAETLTKDFQVPAENLTTQGYGETQLKIPTDGANRANRRVTVRRITPLLASGDQPDQSGADAGQAPATQQ